MVTYAQRKSKIIRQKCHKLAKNYETPLKK